MGAGIASLVGCAQLTDQNPSMLLPLFKFFGEETLYAQIYDPSGNVRDFHPVAENPWWSPQENQIINIAKNDEPIISFTNSRGNIYCDKRSNLIQQLRIACESREASEAFKLSAYELIGDNDQILHHRLKSIECTADELGASSAYAYRNSIAIDLTWRLLERNTVTMDASKKLALFRANVTAKFKDDNLEISLGSMSTDDFTIGIDEITRIISNEMKGIKTVNQIPSKADLSNMGGADLSYNDIVQAVRMSKRQEERIAILIRSILLSPRQGIHFLENYPHNAQFELDAVNIIRQSISLIDIEDQLDVEFRMSLLIRKLISASYPMRKGETIFFFSEHLADFDLMRAQIESALLRSNSFSVNILRKEINESLNRRNSRRK